MGEDNKNKYAHNDDGATHIFAYNKKALELRGENALLNEVEDSGYKVVGSG